MHRSPYIVAPVILLPMTPIISPSDLSILLGNPNLILVDCRHDLADPDAGQRAWRVASLPGSVFLHLDHDLSGEIVAGSTGRHPLPSVTEFQQTLEKVGLNANSFVVVYDDKNGGIAARLWWMLRSLGHEKVAVLDGGFPAWLEEGYRISPGKKVKPKTEADLSHLAAPQANFPHTCDRAQISALPPESILIDSRTAPRYEGEHEPIDRVAGHIPGALNYPWPENIREGRLKARQELKIRFAALGDEADNLVFYCGSGVTACHNILAYTHAYGKMPRLYPGSWSEWIVEAFPLVE